MFQFSWREWKSVTRYNSGAIHKNRQNFKIQIKKFRETEITVEPEIGEKCYQIWLFPENGQILFI